MKRALAAFAIAVLSVLPDESFAQATSTSPGIADTAVYVVDYYYRVKWGYTAEFMRLYKKNHVPVLQAERAAGRIVSISAVAPRYHGTEAERWDYRVTIVFRNVQTAHESQAAPDRERLLRRLFPDQAVFDREEQRRFELLIAHWDVPLTPVPVDR